MEQSNKIEKFLSITKFDTLHATLLPDSSSTQLTGMITALLLLHGVLDGPVRFSLPGFSSSCTPSSPGRFKTVSSVWRWKTDTYLPEPIKAAGSSSLSCAPRASYIFECLVHEHDSVSSPGAHTCCTCPVQYPHNSVCKPDWTSSMIINGSLSSLYVLQRLVPSTLRE